MSYAACYEKELVFYAPQHIDLREFSERRHTGSSHIDPVAWIPAIHAGMTVIFTYVDIESKVDKETP